MALSRVKTWISGEVLTASDLNSEFNNLINNGLSLISPLTGTLDADGKEIILDADADTSITADTDDRIDLRLGGVDLFIFDGTTASCVNGIRFVGTATGTPAYIRATGSDANTGLDLRDTNNNEILKGAAVASAVNEVTVTNAATGTAPSITATGETNVGLLISPKGTGNVEVRNFVNSVCDGRLTLTTGTPVTTGDVTAAETLYFTPFRGNRIAIFDGTDKWKIYAFTELSVDVPDATQMNDVFIYDNAGTLTLEVLAWTNDTTRATALTTQNGVLVKSGATARRYLGSFYSTTAGNGQTEDSVANRYLWNYYNRVDKVMRAVDTTASWTYNTATWRQANAATTNQLNYCVGVQEDAIRAEVHGAVSGPATSAFGVGIGVDVTNANSATISAQNNITTTTASTWRDSYYKGFPGIGKHYLAWVEIGGGATTTFYGRTSAGMDQSGIEGEIRC